MEVVKGDRTLGLKWRTGGKWYGLVSEFDHLPTEDELDNASWLLMKCAVDSIDIVSGRPTQTQQKMELVQAINKLVEEVELEDDNLR